MNDHILPSLSLRLVAVLFLFGGTAIPAERVAIRKSPADKIADLVEMLDHPDFAVREDASRRLLEEGSEAISPLTDAALVKPPEAATRALHVLEKHLIGDEKTEFEPADDALQSLADSERGFVALGAANILSRHWMLREERAIAAIRELGGTVRRDVDHFSDQQWGGPVLLSTNDPSDIRGLKPSEIVIRSDWKGGTEGLKYLRKLSHRDELILYVVRGSGVPLAEAEKLAGTLPGLKVNERGAYIGIKGRNELDFKRCVVDEVVIDGPAARAGLERGDIIRELDGEAIGNFDDLIDKLKGRSAGEQVPITIDRTDLQTRKRVRQTLLIELGNWDLPDLTLNAKQYLENLAAREEAERLMQGLSPEERVNDEPRADQFPLFKER